MKFTRLISVFGVTLSLFGSFAFAEVPAGASNCVLLLTSVPGGGEDVVACDSQDFVSLGIRGARQSDAHAIQQVLAAGYQLVNCTDGPYGRRCYFVAAVR